MYLNIDYALILKCNDWSVYLNIKSKNIKLVLLNSNLTKNRQNMF